MNRKILFLTLSAALMGIALGALIADISKKQTEAMLTSHSVAPIPKLEDHASVWGQNYPLQYESFLKTREQVPTLFGGSMAIPNPRHGADDPREYVSRSKLDHDPRLKIIWAGYPFSIDTREKRGHAYMLIDQIHTQRIKVAPQPGTCLNCHSSTTKAFYELGQGDLQKGFDQLNALPYHQALTHVEHALSCIDCHAPDTMQLRVTRPAFMRSMAKLKASRGVHDYQVNRDASYQEMRTFVCAQCHVDYHFDPTTKELIFPWDKGLKADQVLEYYAENPHSDWTHPMTGANMIKGQHPEFELSSQGPHARAGVSCVDCHMPYERAGARKFTNHHIRSPLLNAEKACLTCHQPPLDRLMNSVNAIQMAHQEMLDTALDALVSYIQVLQKTRERLTKEQLIRAQKIHTEAQFMIDYVEAENSGGFHAPQEAARLLLKAIDLLRQGTEELLELSN